MKRNGDVVMYDANRQTETMKIENKTSVGPLEPAADGANAVENGEYQLFVNRREEICVMQSSADVDCGRYIKVSLTWSMTLMNITNCKF